MTSIETRRESDVSRPIASCFLRKSEVFFKMSNKMLDSVHEVEDAIQQILIFLLLDGRLQTLWDVEGFQLCRSWLGGDKSCDWSIYSQIGGKYNVFTCTGILYFIREICSLSQFQFA